MYATKLIRSRNHEAMVTIPAETSNAPVVAKTPGNIVRSEKLQWASLSPEKRAVLVDQLYSVYRETVHGWTREEFAMHAFGIGDARLIVHYGADDEVAGFSYLTADQIWHNGRRHTVLGGGAFFRLNYRGGKRAALFVLHQAVRFKLRQPGTPIAYLTRSSSPAAYRRLAMSMPRIYPTRKCETAADVEVMVRAISAARQYVSVSGRPWVVRTPAVPNDASRLRRIEHDLDARFFVERNPGFAEGEALLVWIPGNISNIARGFFRSLIRGRF